MDNCVVDASDGCLVDGNLSRGCLVPPIIGSWVAVSWMDSCVVDGSIHAGAALCARLFGLHTQGATLYTQVWLFDLFDPCLRKRRC